MKPDLLMAGLVVCGVCSAVGDRLTQHLLVCTSVQARVCLYCCTCSMILARHTRSHNIPEAAAAVQYE